MFGKGDSLPDARVGTFIGREVEVQGILRGKGSVRIDGQVNGEIEFSGDVYIGEGARIASDVQARNITVAGDLRGTVQASERVELLKSARVHGDIHTKHLVVAEGAIFQGTSDMRAAQESVEPQAQLAADSDIA